MKRTTEKGEGSEREKIGSPNVNEVGRRGPFWLTVCRYRRRGADYSNGVAAACSGGPWEEEGGGDFDTAVGRRVSL